MKTVIITISLFFVSDLSAQPLSALDSANYFDFWVGEWTASWDEGNGIELLGTNTITKNLDNKIITEQFRIKKGKNAGFKGTSISVFQPQTNTWKQAWADNQAGYYDFTGAFEGDKRMFQTASTSTNGDVIMQRMVFYDITRLSMTWDWELSKDGGESWQLSWRIFYKKK
jgi:hypothetical protein